MAVTPSTIRQRSMVALELEADDEYDYTAGQTSTTSTSFVDDKTITVSAGEYLLIAMCTVATNSTGHDTVIKATDGTLNFGEANVRKKNANDLYPWCVVVRVNPTSSKTYTLQYKSSSGSNVIINNRMILAIKVKDELLNSTVSSSSTTTSSTYQTRSNLNAVTPNVSTHMIASAGILNHFVLGLAGTVKARLYDDTNSKTYNEIFIDHQTADKDFVYAHFGIIDHDGTTTTWKNQFGRGFIGSTAKSKYNTFNVLDMRNGKTVALKGGKILGKTLIK